MRTRPDPDVPAAARLLADPSRATMLEALLDGPRTATELARVAGVGLPTVSAHLARLDEAGLITRRDGRIALASADTARLLADALEALARLAPLRAAPLDDGARRISAELRAARSCYDHLAGGLGVAVADALVAARVLTGPDLALTRRGRDWLRDHDLALAPSSRRPASRACLDWSERRAHVAGLLGAALLHHALDQSWVLRVRGSRALRVTDRGTRGFRDLLGITGRS